MTLTAPPGLYTLSLHDALPICQYDLHNGDLAFMRMIRTGKWKLVRFHFCNGLDELYDLESDPGEKRNLYRRPEAQKRSEEHTSELQSQSNLVCRLLLEKKNEKA